MLKDHFASKRQAKIDDKKSKTLFFIEIEFRKNGMSISRDMIMGKYVNHPYMIRFLEGRS
jgi:hypothetical protein